MRELVDRSVGLRTIAREAGAFFVVNGDIEAALLLDADGIHLPAAGGPSVSEARANAPGLLIGSSCHDAAEVERSRGADWIFLSPVFATPSKPDARSLGVDGFSALAALSSSPAYALGGIDAWNAVSCLRAGAAGIAAIRSLLGSRGEDLLRTTLTYDSSEIA
jgi:thiamine-phosphate pyrophosphorylase